MDALQLNFSTKPETNRLEKNIIKEEERIGLNEENLTFFQYKELYMIT